jgi:hypothetical protein
VKRLIVISFLLIILFGAVGLKSRADCEKPDLRVAEKMTCYHLAAVSAAYQEDVAESIELCNMIYYPIQSDPQYDKSNVRVQAESEKNLCMYDIAKIVARLEDSQGGGLNALIICGNIDQDDYSTSLSGAAVTEDMCNDEVKKIAKIRPSSYYGTDPVTGKKNDNICSIVFILPILLFAAVKKMK